MKRSRAAIGTAVLTSALTSLAMLAVAPAASAAEASEPLATGLVGPLQMDVQLVGDKTRIVVAQSFAGLLTEVNDDGTTDVLHAEEKAEVSGVAIDGKKVAFLTTKFSHKNPGAFLKVRNGDGTVKTIANLYKYEKNVNPDGNVRYGFGAKALTDKCEAKLPKHGQSYKGIIESHPYGLANAPGGGWYVADAAGNTILKVTPKGRIKTVAVLPKQKLKVTKSIAEAAGMPGCTVGKKFAFESVPTDVEVAEGGKLIVSLLPGGPEDPAFGARGSVVQVDPATGKSQKLVGGLLGATNVAIGDESMFVSELFGGAIREVDGDAVTTYWEGPTPAALEWSNGYLYAAVDVFNEEEGGSIVKFFEYAD